MEFTIEQLSTDVLKTIFDAAFLDSTIDEDGDLCVEDGMKVWVHGMPEKDSFGYTAYFGISSSVERIKLLEACNSFNETYLGLKATATEGNEAIAFNYTVLMKGGGKIEAKEIVRLLRYFQDVVRNALGDDMFDEFTE